MVLLTRKDTTKNAVAKGRTLSAMFVLRAISQHHPGGGRLWRNKGEATKQTPCLIWRFLLIVVESFGIMDRTALFKATVKTIRTRNKALGVKEATKDILGSKRHKGEFGTKAKEVVRVQPIYVTVLFMYHFQHETDSNEQGSVRCAFIFKTDLFWQTTYCTDFRGKISAHPQYLILYTVLAWINNGERKQ